MKLTTKQKQNLKVQAHHLKPQIQVGRNGITLQQITQIKRSLTNQELIKIKYNDYKNQKEILSHEITEKTGSEQIDLIGNTLIIYKQNPNPTKRKINPDSI